MSDSDRSWLTEFVTVLFVAAVVGLSAVAVWDWSASYTKNTIEADQSARHYAADTQEAIKRTCVDPATMAECITKIIEATQEHQRAEYDLSAQQDMANWAWWMVAISLLSAGITGIGIWFVRENLIAVREANAGARDAISDQRENAERQLRAYVLPHGARVTNFGAGTLIEIEFAIKNFGQTPAYDFDSWVSIWASDFPTTINIPEGSNLPPNVGVLGPGGVARQFAPMGGSLTQNQFDRIKNGQGAIYLGGRFTYRDVFGRQRKGSFLYIYGGPVGARESGEMADTEYGVKAD